MARHLRSSSNVNLAVEKKKFSETTQSIEVSILKIGRITGAAYESSATGDSVKCSPKVFSVLATATRTVCVRTLKILKHQIRVPNAFY